MKFSYSTFLLSLLKGFSTVNCADEKQVLERPYDRNLSWVSNANHPVRVYPEDLVGFVDGDGDFILGIEPPPSQVGDPTKACGEEGSYPLSFYEVVCQSFAYTFLCEALEVTGLDIKFGQSDKQFTFWAPENKSWEMLGEDVLAFLFENKKILKKFILLHVVEGRLRTEDLTCSKKRGGGEGKLKTLAKRKTTTRCSAVGKAFQDGPGNDDEYGFPQYGIEQTLNEPFCNGIAHPINSLILPGKGNCFGKGPDKVCIVPTDGRK
mmetsp:Transcript_6779/g.7722  ORF Transcript_6779/g.7722 Transcript_6779/m.7722 type:complete len:264 (-) Transcript_6779:189-980(-)